MTTAQQMEQAGWEQAQADMAIFGESFYTPTDSVSWNKGYLRGVHEFQAGQIKYPYLAQIL